MRHAPARQVISCLLQGNGFGEKAVTHALAGILCDRLGCPEALHDLLRAHCNQLGADAASPYMGSYNQLPIPRDQRELCTQLAPILIDHPADTGINLASLLVLANLWPHVSSEERPVLRTRYLNGLMSRRSPDGSFAPRELLREWQRDLPTFFGAETPSVANMQGLLNESSPQGAYRRLAEYLGPNVDLHTLGWVLGALSVSILVRFHDPDDRAMHVLLGSVACQQLTKLLPPEHLVVLASQLAHQLWWCRQRASLPPVLTCIDGAATSMIDAVNSGDVTLAQRAARTAARQPELFWDGVWRLLTDSIERRDEHWTRALGVTTAIAWRTGDNAVSPDDAAALAAILAAMAHQRDRVLNS
jgi:hypothetical protein